MRLERCFLKLFAAALLIMFLCILNSNGFLLAGLPLLLGFFVIRRFHPPFPTLWLGGLALVTGAFWCFALQPPITSDFKALFAASQRLLAGDYSFLDNPYFKMWSYQLPFVVWEAGLQKILYSYWIIRISNVLLTAGSVCILYRILKDMIRPEAAQLSMLALIICPLIGSMSVVLTNQVPGAFFLLLGGWILLSRDCGKLGFWRYPLSGITLQIGNLLRPEGILVLAAVLVYGLFRLIREKGKRRPLLLGLACLFACYGLLGAGVDFAVSKTVTPYGIRNNFPEWKFVCGLNAGTRGMYSQEDWDLLAETFENGLATDETKELADQMIRERLHQPADKMLKLVKDKLYVIWDSYALDQAFYYKFHEYPDSVISQNDRRIDNTERALFTISALLALAGIVSLWKRYTNGVFFYAVLFAAFCAFLLVEVQPRYLYFPLINLYACGGIGLDYLFTVIENRRDKLK